MHSISTALALPTPSESLTASNSLARYDIAPVSSPCASHTAYPRWYMDFVNAPPHIPCLFISARHSSTDLNAADADAAEASPTYLAAAADECDDGMSDDERAMDSWRSRIVIMRSSPPSSFPSRHISQ